MTISLPILHKLLVSFTFLHIFVGWILQTCPLLIGISLCLLHSFFSLQYTWCVSEYLLQESVTCSYPNFFCLEITFDQEQYFSLLLLYFSLLLLLFAVQNATVIFSHYLFLHFSNECFKSVYWQFSFCTSQRLSLSGLCLPCHSLLFINQFGCTLAIIFTVSNPECVEFNGIHSFIFVAPESKIWYISFWRNRSFIMKLFSLHTFFVALPSLSTEIH